VSAEGPWKSSGSHRNTNRKSSARPSATLRYSHLSLPGCHKQVQGRDPRQTSDALGAATVQPGPNATGATYRETYRSLATIFVVYVLSPVHRSSFRMIKLHRPRTRLSLIQFLRVPRQPGKSWVTLDYPHRTGGSSLTAPAICMSPVVSSRLQ
jgi:hypothetical protein